MWKRFRIVSFRLIFDPDFQRDSYWTQIRVWRDRFRMERFLLASRRSTESWNRRRLASTEKLLVHRKLPWWSLFCSGCVALAGDWKGLFCFSDFSFSFHIFENVLKVTVCQEITIRGEIWIFLKSGENNIRRFFPKQLVNWNASSETRLPQLRSHHFCYIAFCLNFDRSRSLSQKIRALQRCCPLSPFSQQLSQKR